MFDGAVRVQVKGLLGFLSDAHGNPFGLRASIERLRQNEVKKIFFLGDAVGYMPMADEVLSILKKEKVTPIMGNHDAMLSGLLPINPQEDKIYGLEQLRKTMDKDKIHQVSSWPRRLELEVEGRRILLVHGSPWEELTDYVYPDGDLAAFESLGFSAIFLGHTHRPFCKKVGETLVVNVGSCGMPRDEGNLASCVLYDTCKNDAKIIRVPFDVGAVLSASLKTTSMPDTVRKCLYRSSRKGNIDA